ncbi:MAG TPA: hypothetical protein VFX98_12140 [Longimicrobiaceae bacterium]|nr:hypothetical protein [Longimicrobiaceae bacterium]
MSRFRLPATAVVPLLLLAACGGEPEPTDAQRTARRDACVGEELLIQARTRLADLDAVAGRTEPGSAAALLTERGRPLAAALAEYAERRHRETAYRDSAASAPGGEEADRFRRQAASYQVGAYPAGTVQANAIERYEEDFRVARANPDHPCNQEAEEETAR